MFSDENPGLRKLTVRRGGTFVRFHLLIFLLDTGNVATYIMNKTTDLWLVCYLLKNKKEMDTWKYKDGKCEFYFKIDNDEWKKLKLLFKESSVNEVKLLMLQLKDLIN